MSLESGTTLGSYQVTAKIGEGGMGEVWQAIDTKLDRNVALKVLPEAFTSDPDRLARFEREAKVLASLNHPNIGTIHGLEESDGVKALVLELVEGPTLAGRIAQGPIPLDEALPIARQIAEALEAAHEAGVIHRDLKPANIKVREDGTVKVLDFGLAKALEPTPTGDPSQSPTLTAAATQMGVIMGTAAYMSPEQAKGKTADRRTDVWAFGAVLYEMLAGRRAFEGEDVSDTLVSVFRDEPDWSRLSSEVPARVRQAIQVCLQKDPKQRVRDVAAVRLALEGAFETTVSVPSGQTVTPHVEVWQRPVAIAVTVLAALVLGGLAAWTWLGGRAPTPPPVRFTLTVPESDLLRTDFGNLLALSPDGETVVYAAIQGNTFQLFQRPIGQFEATPIPNTENGVSPFFSPDGQSVGLSTTFDSELRSVALAGGPSQRLTLLDGLVGADWAQDDTIIYGLAAGGGLMSLSSGGGDPTSLFTPQSSERIWRPQKLPGGDAVLFTLWDGSPETGGLHLLMLDTGDDRMLVPNAVAGRVLDTGHLVFWRSGALWAVPFDLGRLDTVGTPVPLVEGVRIENGGAVQYAVADNGTLVYIPEGDASGMTKSLLWVDSDGDEQPLAVDSGDYRSLSLSPDGNQAALEIAGTGDETDIWVADLTRGTRYRITRDDGTAQSPLWSPDGRRVVFMSRRNGHAELFSTPADGTGEAELLVSFDASMRRAARPTGWLPDGGLIVQANFTGTTGDIGVVSPDGDNSWQPLVQTTDYEGGAVIDPNGRWMAYYANDSGRPQLYIQRFPDLSGRRPVTPNAYLPTWSPDGRELFYLRNPDDGPPDAVMRVTVQDPDPVGGEIGLGDPAVLVDFPYFSAGSVGRTYDVSPDGRLLVMSTGDAPAGSVDSLREIKVVLNWTQELLERVPVN